MRRKLARKAFAIVCLVGIAAMPTTLRGEEEEAKYIWGVSNDGDTCGGKCTSKNICCKITPIAPNVPG